MSIPVTQTPTFRRDVSQVAHYLEQQSSRVGQRFVDALEKAVEQLADIPEIGSLLDLEDEDLAAFRYWPIRGFDNYLLIYQIREEDERTLQLTRLVHASQNIERLLS